MLARDSAVPALVAYKAAQLAKTLAEARQQISTTTFSTIRQENNLASIKQTLDDILTIDGAMCAAVVDSGSGMILGAVGSGVDMEIAAAGNTEVVRAKLKTMQALGLSDVIEDILITLGKQYHIIRPSASKRGCLLRRARTSSAPTSRWPAARRRTWTS